ncbi:hypothetical protein POTOM_053437 [Populus tomentosa]|uniref:Gnk2-homologous domain-containing protein n=1 Tax=Populus tomentosa TaxID=118781 RepID=A0A8X8C680_POPTO|nr:hypothetical protein POTOM_053437 [Populus tomentosa]
MGLRTMQGDDSIMNRSPNFHFCSSPENFTANGPYESNLNKLTSYLYYKAPPTGFGKGSRGHTPDQTYGLALCRGDVSTSDCKTCVVEASSEIRKRCPYNKAAIIWYDNCLLKYSNNGFFGQIDTGNKFYMWNVHVVSEPAPFNEKTKELLSQLANEAQATPKLFATGERELGKSTKLYGLVQCTGDLSSAVCKKCLDGIIGVNKEGYSTMDSLSIGLNTLRKATGNLCDEYRLGQGGIDRFSLQGIPSYVHLMRAKHLPTFYNVCKKGFQEAQDRVRRAQNTEVLLVSKLLHRNQ